MSKETIPSNRSFEEDLKLPFYTEKNINNVLDNDYFKLLAENKRLCRKISEIKRELQDSVNATYNKLQHLLKDL